MAMYGNAFAFINKDTAKADIFHFSHKRQQCHFFLDWKTKNAAGRRFFTTKKKVMSSKLRNKTCPSLVYCYQETSTS